MSRGRLQWRLSRLAWWAGSSRIVRKLAIAAFVATIGGIANVGATDLYAWTYASRVPVEGVPYLSLAIALLSGLLSASALLFHSYAASVLSGVFRRTGWTLKLVLAESVIIAPSLLLLYMVWYFFGVPLWIPLTLVALFALPCVLLVAWPILESFLELIVTTALVVALMVCMLSPSNYASFLRQIRYGGGGSITIQYEATSGDMAKITGYLFLITNESYILYRKRSGNEGSQERSQDAEEFIEIPSMRISSVRYPVCPEYVMPARIE